MNKCLLKFLSVAFMVSTALPVFAQEEEDTNKDEKFLPKSGDMSIGLSFNPSGAKNFSFDAAANEKVGEKSKSIMSFEEDMLAFTENSVAAIQFKYKLTNTAAFVGSLGFNGMQGFYRKYVNDDYAQFLDPLSNAQVVDQIHYNLHGGTLKLGLEYSIGNRIRFNMGAHAFYAIGGGSMKYTYGNALTEVNQQPTVADLLDEHNKWNKDNSDIAYARPTYSYTQGLIQSVGLKIDAGLEAFIAPKISVQGKMVVTPVMYSWQPQTHTKYEGYSNALGKVVKDYVQLGTPGSRYCTYGIQGLSAEFSINYYF